MYTGRDFSVKILSKASKWSRHINTSSSLFAFRDKFVKNEDLNKRPSELEIRKKDLPKNTPTLGERIRRDRDARFFEMDRKSGYFHGKTGGLYDYMKDHTPKSAFKMLTEDTKKQFKMLYKEMQVDPFSKIPLPGETRIFYKFDTDEGLKQWKTTCDSDWGEGYSTCSLQRSPNGKALFSGELSTRIPQDGRIQRAGYCNMAALKKFRSFWRTEDLKWDYFTHLVMKVRGDGRTYLINLQTKTHFDIHSNDLWHYRLFTRGGPYWQNVKIPLGKFYLGSKGSIVEDNHRCPFKDIESINLTIADKVDGPFSLEIDNIGLYRGNHRLAESFAYETYVFPMKNYLY